MKKYIKSSILIIFLTIIVIFIFKLFLSPGERYKPINVIPENSAFLVEADDPFKAWENISETHIWKQFLQNQFFSEINKTISSADSLLDNNKLLFKTFGSRYVLLSLHRTQEKKYEPLFIADLERYSKLSSIKKYVFSLNKGNLNITKRNFDNYEIYEIFHKTQRETYYLSFYKNLAIFAFNHHLLEKSLECINSPVLGREDKFLEVHNQIYGEGLIRMYIHYGLFKTVLTDFNIPGSEIIDDLLESVYYSGLSLSVSEYIFKIDGVTNLNKDRISYLNALSKSGSGNFEAQKIIPKSARFFVRLGFDSFNEFLTNFEELLKEDGSFEEYQKNYEKIEKKLDIDINKNLISWIDDEITIASIEPKYKGLDEELFLILKTKNKKSATKNLDFINDQIRKNTPIKFTTVDYNGYSINYLQATGLIKLIFGKLFSRMEKPYYTQIDDFIVFSNHPQALKNMIDNYIENKTINKWEPFIDFYESNFDKKSSVFMFVNSPYTLNSLEENVLKSYKNEIEQNHFFFEHIPFWGLEMKSNENLFQTNLILKSNDNLYLKELVNLEKRELDSVFDTINTDELIKSAGINFINRDSVLLKDPFKIEDIVIIDLTAKEYNEYFKNNTLKIKLDVSNGIKEGKYVEYYENGEIKLKGKFENDKQVGVWKYYNDDGDLVEKRKF